jgi:hypothetical protein
VSAQFYYDRHVSTALKSLMKGVQANGEFDEDDLEDIVSFSGVFRVGLN